MHEVCVNITVVGRVAVQILMGVDLKHLEARICYHNVKAEVFQRSYVPANFGDDARDITPVREHALYSYPGVGMRWAGGDDVLLNYLGVVETPGFLIDVSETTPEPMLSVKPVLFVPMRK